MNLTEEEERLIQRWRRAHEGAREDQSVTVNIYTGSKRNGQKLLEICDLMHRLDQYSPTMPIEGFLVPVPSDPTAASVLRQGVLENVNNIFDNNAELDLSSLN